jgi:predicted dehydrogenase
MPRRSIHDFDLARWFMGDVKTVAAIGATIASLTFTSGKLGVV